MTASALPPSTLLATGLPPGWIELAALRDEQTMHAFLDAQLDVDAQLFTDEHRSMVHQACATVFDLVRAQQWLHLGAVVTSVADPDEPAEPRWRTTTWSTGVGVLPTPTSRTSTHSPWPSGCWVGWLGSSSASPSPSTTVGTACCWR